MKYSKKTLLVYILVTTALITGLILCIHNPGELFDFPLNADVWGRVSDWFILIITSITAYFIYNTLQQQKKATENQVELNDYQIRLNRLIYRTELKKIMPVFKLKDPRTKDPTIEKIVVLTNAQAYNIIVDKYPKNSEHSHKEQETLEVDSELINIPAKHKGEIPGPHTDHYYIYFEDEIGTKYKQIIKTNEKVEYTITDPILIPNKELIHKN